ncbi:MAG: hypothetical protein ABIJ21_03850 [Nanoarchaeota archaeon]
MKRTQAKSVQAIWLLMVIGVSLITWASVSALPVGPTISVTDNSTISSTPYSLANAGGYLYYGSISATQQNYAWKAYIGNVTGLFTLDDTEGRTIYDWSVNASELTGEIYATRNNSIDWTWINCSNSSVRDNETTFFGMVDSAPDSINSTFNESTHKPMQVATSTINESTCRMTSTYVNDTKQTVSVNSVFQELLLMDAHFSLIYATFIEQDQFNYQTNSTDNVTSDFQLILPENKTLATPTTYYFYVEI